MGYKHGNDPRKRAHLTSGEVLRLARAWQNYQNERWGVMLTLSLDACHRLNINILISCIIYTNQPDFFLIVICEVMFHLMGHIKSCDDIFNRPNKLSALDNRYRWLVYMIRPVVIFIIVFIISQVVNSRLFEK